MDPVWLRHLLKDPETYAKNVDPRRSPPAAIWFAKHSAVSRQSQFPGATVGTKRTNKSPSEQNRVLSTVQSDDQYQPPGDA
jgi:hypothetical protein